MRHRLWIMAILLGIAAWTIVHQGCMQPMTTASVWAAGIVAVARIIFALRRQVIERWLDDNKDPNTTLAVAGAALGIAGFGIIWPCIGSCFKAAVWGYWIFLVVFPLAWTYCTASEACNRRHPICSPQPGTGGLKKTV